MKKENEGTCLECGKKTNYDRISKGYNIYCNNKCLRKSDIIKDKRKETNLKKYGVENISQLKSTKEKKVKKSIEKYGVEYPLRNKKVLEKTKLTNIEKYGVENVFQSEHVKKKIKKTNIEKYGVEYPSQNKKIRDKQKVTCLKKYGFSNPNQSVNIKNKSRNQRIYNLIPKVKEILKNNNIELLSEYKNNRELIKLKCLKCNSIFKSNYFNIQQGCGKCPNCFPKYKSNSEIELLEYIKSIEFSKIIENDRNILNGKELDIFIPDKNIAIEFNGLYWHSETKGKDKNYHLNKTELCKSKNVQLIHIFEDEWINNKQEIKDVLKRIILDNYDLLNKTNNTNIVDRRFSKNFDYYINKGYKVKVESPKLYLNHYNYKIYDCGFFQLEN